MYKSTHTQFNKFWFILDKSYLQKFAQLSWPETFLSGEYFIFGDLDLIPLQDQFHVLEVIFLLVSFKFDKKKKFRF